MARKGQKKNLKEEDLVLEVCKRHQVEALGLLTDLNDTWIRIDKRKFQAEKRITQRLFDAQAYTDLIQKHDIRICGTVEQDRLIEVVALNLVFAEDALRLAKSG